MRYSLWIVVSVVCVACGGSPDSQNGNSHILPITKAECSPETGMQRVFGSFTSEDAKQYFIQPFSVSADTRRIEVGYGWVERGGATLPLDGSTIDLGLWDQHGYRSAKGFRGWSGSRQGRVLDGQVPVWVEAGSAERGYSPGPINPGVWSVEIGVGAVTTAGTDWFVEIECLAAASNSVEPADDPADPERVANTAEGWYHGDFHMHGYHSNAEGKTASEMADIARSVGLDILFYTEYVVPQHWHELGTVEQANPDLLFYPGREIITYYGHANTFGETPDVVEYRHGFEDIDLGQIQRDSVAAGALFQINHPTIFPEPVFTNVCRGCEFNLDDVIDWSLVTSMELVSVQIEADATALGGPVGIATIENPFTTTAIDEWHQRLNNGYRITGVSGSDARGHETLTPGRAGYGSVATALYLSELSRAAVREALIAGRAVIKTYGALHSPTVNLVASNGDGDTAGMGDDLPLAMGQSAQLEIRIQDAAGQTLELIRNGSLVQAVLISSDDFSYSGTIARESGEGPIGTFWRFDVRAPLDLLAAKGPIRTIISNPVWLVEPEAN